jgi:hypothetical protein
MSDMQNHEFSDLDVQAKQPENIMNPRGIQIMNRSKE